MPVKETVNKVPVTAIDIGSSKILVVIAEAYDDGSFKVLGHGRAVSEGIRAGSISDQERLLACLNEALDEAVRISQFKGTSYGRISMTISGEPIEGRDSRAELPLPGSEVTAEDIKHVIERAEDAMELTGEERLIKSERLFFQIDKQTEAQSVENPLGLKGSRLTVTLHSAVSSSVNAVNRVQLVKRTGLADIQTVMPEGWASGWAVLTEERRKMGVVLIDIGAETTDIVVFKDGYPRFTHTMNFGGNALTRSLAGYMNCSLEEAEQVKMRLDLRLKEADKSQIVATVGEAGFAKQFNKHELSSILVNELVLWMRQVAGILWDAQWYSEVDNAPYSKLYGTVVTGGTAMLMGLTEFMSSVPGPYHDRFVTTCGLPLYKGDASIGLNSPKESAVMGLVAYEARRFALGEDESGKDAVQDTLWDRIKRIAIKTVIGEF